MTDAVWLRPLPLFLHHWLGTMHHRHCRLTSLLRFYRISRPLCHRSHSSFFSVSMKLCFLMRFQTQTLSSALLLSVLAINLILVSFDWSVSLFETRSDTAAWQRAQREGTLSWKKRTSRRDLLSPALVLSEPCPLTPGPEERNKTGCNQSDILTLNMLVNRIHDLRACELKLGRKHH